MTEAELRAEIKDIESERSRLKRELKQYGLQLRAEVKDKLDTKRKFGKRPKTG